MIEKKIFSDEPPGDKHFPVNDGLSKNFIHHKEETIKDEQINKDPDKEEKKEVENLPVKLPDAPDMKIALFFTEILGKESFERIRKDGNFLVPFTDETTSLTAWIAHSIRMLFKSTETEAMGLSIDKWLKKQHEVFNVMEKELEHLTHQLSEKESLGKQLENDYLIADSERKQLRRDLLTSVSAVYLVDLFLPKGVSKESDKIAGLLKEEMMNPGEDFPTFVTGFLEGWKLLKPVVENVEDNEVGMEALHLELTSFLERIAEKSISQRRPILNIIAGMCNAHFKVYKFISPEETLQVDPRIHSATALGGSTIREGISFAVIRRDTMQTVKYAEIKV